MNSIILSTILALAGSPAQAPEVTASSLISKMLLNYNSARSAQGRITTKQSAKNVTVETLTEIAIQQTARLLIRQTRTGTDGGRFLAIADGEYFAYDRPKGVLGKPRFVEPQFNYGRPMTLREVYMVVSGTFAEKSPPLDIIISRRDDLESLRNKWGKKFEISGKAEIRGQSVYVVRGTFLPFAELRNSVGEKPQGVLEMSITEDGQLLKYVELANYVVPSAAQELIAVRTEWDLDIKLNGEIDSAIFSPVR
jgi:hypothetical protein